MQESAFLNPPWLLEREGAGYIQVTELLYRIAEQCRGNKTAEEIADAISAAGKPVNPATVRSLITQLLIPRGLVEMADGSVVPVATGASSPLALNMRMKMIGPEAIMPATNFLRWLYWPPILVTVLVAAALAQGWLYLAHGVSSGLRDALYTPGLILIVLLIVVVSAAFHELGHAAALHYAGARIKGMGAGIYIVYPAFFTDVSDNYRLPRWQRVRTDLGGFYFNLIFTLGIMGLFVLSGQEFLLLLVLMINLEILHQLLPFLRLDGYWTLADITGVPDFFSQMAAFVRSVLPIKAWKGRKLPPLKWWAKVVFAVYTLITIPLLLLLLVLMVRSVPRVLATAWDSLGQQGQAFVAAQTSGDIPDAVASVGQALLLSIPTLGLGYTLFSLGRRFTVGMWNWGKPSVVRRATSAVCLVSAAGLLGFMWAADERGRVQDVVSDVVASGPTTPLVERSTPQSTGDVQTRGTPEPTLAATPAADVTAPLGAATATVLPGAQQTPAPRATTPSGALTPTPVR
ncbi:MAG: hypothetical protein E6I75_15570 [Chloroflexi bacterium]|nr:MAG: hypothetical protein E6I75_15570 [Chloroflexota bacterium]